MKHIGWVAGAALSLAAWSSAAGECVLPRLFELDRVNLAQAGGVKLGKGRLRRASHLLARMLEGQRPAPPVQWT